MSDISRVSLFGRFGTVPYQALESATVFCKLRGNPYVELVHWLHQMLQNGKCDIALALRHFDADDARLSAGVLTALDSLPRGATSISDFSPALEDMAERGWIFASLMFGSNSVRSGHLLVGLLKSNGLRNLLFDVSGEFRKIRVDELVESFSTVCSGSIEVSETRPGDGQDSDVGTASNAIAPASMGKQEALRKFTTDLTALAREGKIDPIIGRDDEIRQVVDILMRRRQNNPILVGEAGVGKTAVVEGFALRIARGDVPPAIRDVELRSLDVGLLQAGASMKGEFEQRLRSVIEEVQASPRPVILFVDETHTLVGAGGAVGTGDAANLLKPALARGTLRTIGATTFAEYKRHIEKDPALTRRFQTVQVDEPDEDRAVRMMRGVVGPMEQHHGVFILDEAIQAAVRLSSRYIPARQLPDKSVSLLDTASARVAVGLHATPAPVERCRKNIDMMEHELAIIRREMAIGMDIGTRFEDVVNALDGYRATLQTLEGKWSAERTLVNQIIELRDRLHNAHGELGSALPVPEARSTVQVGVTTGHVREDNDEKKAISELNALKDELARIQGDEPLMQAAVDYDAVAAVVEDWTGIPVGRMARNEIETVLNLEEHLRKRVIGQDHAMEMIARRIRTSRAGLENPNKPVGVFMLAGTSGVGKTETALALAEALYGGEQNLITINMSEFQEAHTASTLKGAPPGYIGYGEGGVLTEAVRRRPYSVILLDEVEKAHPDVHEMFFQVFDKGYMEDGEGRFIDFKNTIILLTTNAGTEVIEGLFADPDLAPGTESLAKAIRDPLLKVFPPALLGRLVTIPYLPLRSEIIARIVELQLGRIEKRIMQRYKVAFEYTPSVVELIVSRCNESASGGRMIDSILNNSMLPAISGEFLTRTMGRLKISSVRVSVDNGDFSYAFDD